MDQQSSSSFANFLRGPAASLLLAAISVAGALVASFTGISPSIKADPDRAVLIAVIIFLVGEVLKLSWQMSSMRQLAKSIDNEMTRVCQVLPKLEQFGNLLPTHRKTADLEKSLHTCNDQIGKTGLDTIERTLTLMESIPGGTGFQARSETLALIAYEIFWENLREKQKAGLLKTPPVVRVTHSCSTDIWDEPQLDRALELQEQFIKAGGTIVRVFLDATDSPSQQIKGQMERMQSYGMSVFYTQNTKLDRLESDFLWTEPFLVEWLSGATRQALLGCRISEPGQQRRNEIRDQWKEIGKKIMRSAHPASDPKIATILQDF